MMNSDASVARISQRYCSTRKMSHGGELTGGTIDRAHMRESGRDKVACKPLVPIENKRSDRLPFACFRRHRNVNYVVPTPLQNTTVLLR